MSATAVSGHCSPAERALRAFNAKREAGLVVDGGSEERNLVRAYFDEYRAWLAAQFPGAGPDAVLGLLRRHLGAEIARRQVVAEEARLRALGGAK
jgi:hypothetical protein